MKIELYTDKAQVLTNKIFKSVDDETIKTWISKTDTMGVKYLTHKPEQWEDKAVFVFEAEKFKLVITLLWLTGNEPTNDIKGYYMGRFTEILLVHFSNEFSKFEIIK